VLNTDFVGLLFDANQVNAVVKSWQSGAIPTSDKNDALKQYGLIDATKSDDEIENEISAEGGGLNLTDPALEPPPATEEPPPDE
jgi:hypothetical protein